MVCAAFGLLLCAQRIVADAIVTTGAEVRSFLGNKAGKLVYTRWELNEEGDPGWKTGRSLWYIDFSESTLREREIVRFEDVEPRNAIVSPDGQWVTFNTFLDDDLTNAESYICRLQENAQSTLIKIGIGGQPHWWTKPGTTEEYLIYSSGDLENGWNKYWQEKGETFIQRIDNQTKQPLGLPQLLLPYYANSGRSKAGGWLFVSGRATGAYKIDALDTEQAHIFSQTEWQIDRGCNPSISPHRSDKDVLVMINGAAVNSDLGYGAHTYFMIRDTKGTIVKAVPNPLRDENRYLDTPEWSSHVDYATVTGMEGDLVPPCDVFLFRISDTKFLKVIDGNNQWPYLWVEPEASELEPVVPGDTLKGGAQDSTPVFKPTINITNPRDGQTFVVGDTLHFQFSADTQGIDKIDVWLLPGGGSLLKLTPNGIKPRLDSGVRNPQWESFDWIVPELVGGQEVTSRGCKVMVGGSKNGIPVIADTSGSFTLKSRENPSSVPLVTLVAPNGSESYHVGDTLYIRWTADMEKIFEVDLWLVFDDRIDELKITTKGGIFAYSGPGVINPQWGNYPWVIPANVDGMSTVSNACSIIIRRYNATIEAHSDISDGTFSIAPAPDTPPDTIPANGSDSTQQTSAAKSGGGCGTGAGLAFLPPLFYVLRRKAKPKSSRE